MSIGEFEKLNKTYALQEVAQEECPMCGNSMTYYDSEYVEGVDVRFCHTCHELETAIDIDPDQDNICPVCGEIVKHGYGDEDANNFVECSVEGCERKAHLSCVKDEICEECNIWACPDDTSEFIECEHCWKLHDYDCIVSFDSEFLNEFGFICNSCFYKRDNLIKDVGQEHQSPFEKIRRINEHGMEYWSARDLQKVLGYKDFRNLETAIKKADFACKNSGHKPSDHIVEATAMIEIGKNANREFKDYHLSRYGCYLLIQNADPSKPMVALGQTYFAVQTRKQEIHEEAIKNQKLKEEKQRLFLREEMKKHNTQLAAAAKEAGIERPVDYAIFQNHGYRGLYGGLDQKDIHRHKRLKTSQKILDHMGSTELAANLFRATQTEEKIRRERIRGKEEANLTHYQVGAKVRQTIRELGGTMPEDLPTAEDIKKIERKHKKLLESKKPKK